MKKITFLFFILTINVISAQSTSTGQITLTPGFTLQLDVDVTNDKVYMTMTGPKNVWLGVAFDAQSMSSTNKDVVIYSSNGLRDYYLNGTGTPPQDSNDWTVLSNNETATSRTIVAFRTLNTGQSTDYVFSSNTGNISLLWAKGNGLNLAYHGSRGMAMGTFTLGTPEVSQQPFEVYPNPTINHLNFKFPTNVQATSISVFDVLGKTVLNTTLTPAQPTLDTSSWSPGMYIVQMVTGDNVQTKRVIKQ